MRTMIRRLALLGTIMSLPALAQTTTPPAATAMPPSPPRAASTTTSGNAAAQVDSGTRAGALEHGANSFTEGQARSRIEAAGFTNLQGLRKDDSGIWRGTGSQGGRQVEVGLDYRGNVAPVTR